MIMRYTPLILCFYLLALAISNKNGDININNGQTITINIGGSHSSHGKSDNVSHSGHSLQDFITDPRTLLLMMYLLDYWVKQRANNNGKNRKNAIHLDTQGTAGDKAKADKERGPTNPITIPPPKK